MLEGLSTAKGATAQDIAEELVAVPARRVGYLLRGLARRGWVESDGRRHGGALKWRLTTRGFSVVFG